MNNNNINTFWGLAFAAIYIAALLGLTVYYYDPIAIAAFAALPDLFANESDTITPAFDPVEFADSTDCDLPDCDYILDIEEFEND